MNTKSEIKIDFSTSSYIIWNFHLNFISMSPKKQKLSKTTKGGFPSLLLLLFLFFQWLNHVLESIVCIKRYMNSSSNFKSSLCYIQYHGKWWKKKIVYDVIITILFYSYCLFIEWLQWFPPVSIARIIQDLLFWIYARIPHYIIKH